MNQNDFERLNTLSEKALNETVDQRELKEFKQLLTFWNSSAELKLFGDIYITYYEDRQYNEFSPNISIGCDYGL